MILTPLIGVGLTGVVTIVLVRLLGAAALAGAVTFGLVATAIQWVSVALMRTTDDVPFRSMMARWAAGMALRLGGVVLIVIAVLVSRETFDPLAAAFGYLGVVIPLLFMELRLIR